jgi:hypothetical protein
MIGLTSTRFRREGDSWYVYLLAGRIDCAETLSVKDAVWNRERRAVLPALGILTSVRRYDIWRWNHGYCRRLVHQIQLSRYISKPSECFWFAFALPGLNRVQNFHYCGLEPNNMIVNYDNSTEVWTCELGSEYHLSQVRHGIDWRTVLRADPSLAECVFMLEGCLARVHTDLYGSLATETEDVRSRLAAYGNDLLSLGVDGLRLDAAKVRFLVRPLWLIF